MNSAYKKNRKKLKDHSYCELTAMQQQEPLGAPAADIGSSQNGSSSEDSEESVGGDGNAGRRVAEQLQILKSLIPNIKQTDERSIVEETRDYLQRIHHDTDQIERELLQQSQGSSSLGSQRYYILGVETEKLMEGRFVIKIRWRKGPGVAGHMQRVIDLLDVKMISVEVNDQNAEEMLTTAFVKVKKDMQMTEEGLQDLVIKEAQRSGLSP
ncbi:uncharacterized protein LOC131227874 [Magnolia sinica]|uniref:uncharacterized protein LOC131227874 n=1 Tax=Magnolia sinica TaxID=86752 RepID=UPI002659945A|nr:uncharacterized protein LOC131227874 [Magnolia sinica]